MSEFEQSPPPEAFSNNTEALRIHDKELAHLGALVMEAAMRDDLVDVTAEHSDMTGVAQPNSVPAEGSTGFHVASAEVPMNSDSVYRQVHGEAILDLAKSGVVRNPVTAGVKEKARWGDKVFWHLGEDRKNAQLGGRIVIEADKDAARSGWVTADKVSGLYAKDADGLVKNIIAPNK